MQTASDRLEILTQAHELISVLEIKEPIQGDSDSEKERNLKRNILNEMQELFPIFVASAEAEGMKKFRSES